MNGFKIAVLGLSTALLAACASGPTAEELRTADYGREISAEECAEIAEKLIRPQMKDPYSANFVHQPCFKGIAQKVPIAGLPVHFGYIQNGTVNAKNSFGAYVGAKKYHVVINNGDVLRHCVGSGKYNICIPN